jgi:hypothetical protein
MTLKSFLNLTIVGFAAMSLLAACSSGESETETMEADSESMQAEADVPPNTLSEQEVEDGWILLFDGESTEGWRGYQQESFPESGWIIEDGALKVQGAGTGEAGGAGGDILFDQKFQNFHLSLEWKVSEGGNSGIFYLAQELDDRPIWHSAPEMQILDNANHPDAMLGENGNRQAGSLYDLIPAEPQNFNGHGEWNKAEVLVYRGTVVHFQNGEPVVEYHLGTPAWEDMVNNSKFADYSDVFGKFEPGYISLQDHGDDVWFRNIKLQPRD